MLLTCLHAPLTCSKMHSTVGASVLGVHGCPSRSSGKTYRTPDGTAIAKRSAGKYAARQCKLSSSHFEDSPTFCTHACSVCCQSACARVERSPERLMFTPVPNLGRNQTCGYAWSIATSLLHPLMLWGFFQLLGLPPSLMFLSHCLSCPPVVGGCSPSALCQVAFRHTCL